ncbi:hypothetical protein GUJ93_ZPchr0141g33462 [Zizania palustris]|uniref:Uncharacterized protein n=1 Tax=Zizania palustris TaxID=103762 RepID=A0A8J5V0J4_ZIZPA|nr:hypothetical protein GUJ93_ZPchr0141g33462 [Zizania palustris]
MHATTTVRVEDTWQPNSLHLPPSRFESGSSFTSIDHDLIVYHHQYEFQDDTKYFGCATTKNVKNKVLSIDLGSEDPSVIACDMAH